jgi:micrococcal nuclease
VASASCSPRPTRPAPTRLFVLFLLVVLLLAAAAGLADGCSRLGPAAAPSGAALEVPVTRVVDGDTIAVTRDGAEVRVRLIGIDTPETKKPNTPVECYGREASARTEELLPPGTTVRLEYDVDRVDTYGRDLAYVYREPDGLFVNRSLVADGFAALDTFRPNVAHLDELSRAADDARRLGRGLWQACGGGHRAT